MFEGHWGARGDRSHPDAGDNRRVPSRKSPENSVARISIEYAYSATGSVLPPVAGYSSCE